MVDVKIKPLAHDHCIARPCEHQNNEETSVMYSMRIAEEI